MFSSYDRVDESAADMTPKGRIGSFQVNSKNSSLTKINKEIRNQKGIDLSGSGNGKYKMHERLITEEVRAEHNDDFDFRKLSS